MRPADGGEGEEQRMSKKACAEEARTVSTLKRVGDTVSFLRRSYRLEEEGVSIRPGQYGENMVKAYGEKKGRLKLQQLPCDSTFHMEDSSPDL